MTIPQNKIFNLVLKIPDRLENEELAFRKLVLPQVIEQIRTNLSIYMTEEQMENLLSRIIEKNGTFIYKRKAFTIKIREQKILAKEMYAPRKINVKI
jgi:hypothetical protein